MDKHMLQSSATSEVQLRVLGTAGGVRPSLHFSEVSFNFMVLQLNHYEVGLACGSSVLMTH